MRKWIIIGVAGIAMVAVLEFLLTRPKKGTVEWHKREYLSAAQTLRDGTWSARLKDLYYKAIRKPAPTTRLLGDAEKRAADRLRASQTALVEVGYFSQYRFTLTNTIASALLNKFFNEESQRHFTGHGTRRQHREWSQQMELVDVTGEGKNVLRLTGPRQVVERLEKYVRSRISPSDDDLKNHQRELIRFGYLEEQTYFRSNVGLHDLESAVQRAVAKRNTNQEFSVIGTNRKWTNGVRAVTRKGMMPTEEEVLREIEAAKIEE